MSIPKALSRLSNPSARAVALLALLECRTRQAFVQEILDQQLQAHPALSPADRRLATSLVYGVLRRQGTLDALLKPLINRPTQQVEPWLRDVLRLGAFQLVFLTNMPEHAALFETVNLAALAERAPAKPFLNGVLRAFARLLTPRFGTEPGSDMLPVEIAMPASWERLPRGIKPGDPVYRKLSKPALPDPHRQPAEYLAAAFSLPLWLAERWLRRFGPAECQKLGFWFISPPPLWLRVNPLRTSREQLLQALAEAKIHAESGQHPQSLRLAEPRPVRELPGYAAGWFSVQDESATVVASALAPRPGDNILDLCAAPGGKTTHLAELMHNTGRIVACDVEEERLQQVNELADRLGLTIIQTCRINPARQVEAPEGPFDGVLVDVPCTNTGVLGRRPEVRWRLEEEDLRRLPLLQRRLLRQGCNRVRPGGTVVYSTCSVEPEENGRLIRRFLRDAPEMILEAEEERTPGAPADGGYWARLRKKEGANP